MQWIEQNIDAYRIVGEILNTLRTTMRKELEVIHGRDWHRVGVQREIIDRLIERKEQEKAIDWHETEYQELIDYASFTDLLQMLENNPEILPQVARLAPSTALLHARLLELEVMRTKLGMCRPISETELSFLGTFHLRFRQAMEGGSDRTPPPRPAPEPTPEPELDSAKTTMVETASEPEQEAQADEPEEAGSTGEDPGTQPIEVARPRPPLREASKPAADEAAAPAEASTAKTQPETEPETEAEAKTETEAEPKPDTRTKSRLTGPAALEAALEEQDHRVILRQLYKEVMTIAEGMWSNDTPPLPMVWEKVRVSEWYESNFSSCGLKPLSDFYDVISQIQDRSRDGMTRDQLQQFLKESNFAQLLLALRDMFQKNQI
jgi:hypothetical protein